MDIIYMVSLADRLSGQEQRVLVTAPATDTETDIHDFILGPGVVGTKGETITLSDPVVLNIRQLHIKRPIRNTNFATIAKAATV